MGRNSLFRFPRVPRSVGLGFALLFSFLRTKKVVQWKKPAAGRPCSSLMLEDAAPEAVSDFQRGDLLTVLSPPMSRSKFYDIQLFLLF